MNEPQAIIQVRGLARRFGDVEAVAGVDFDVRAGELFGFLGPNGAGKTSTMRMLSGVLAPTAGTARIHGHDIRCAGLRSRSQLAVVPEDANVYVDLSVWQNIQLMAALYGVPRRQRAGRAERLLEVLGLAERRRDKAGALSKGLRQRLMLATALVTRPDVLFLDEPTSGLDVHSTRLIRRIVTGLNADGLTVLLTTHDMAEAEQMCSRVAIIKAGRIAAIDTPERLRSAIGASQYVEVALTGAQPELAELEALDGVSRVVRQGGAIRLYTATPGRVAAEVVRLAEAREAGIERLCTCKPSLEDVFVHFTADQAQEPPA